MGCGSNTAKVVLLFVHAFGWFGVSLTGATEETIILNVTSEYLMPPPTDVPPHMYIKATTLRAVDNKFVYVQRYISPNIYGDSESYFQIDVSTLLGYIKMNGAPMSLILFGRPQWKEIFEVILFLVLDRSIRVGG